MAIYHYEETPVKRSKGQSAVNSAAYVLKEDMRDNNINKDFSYERQNKEVEYSKTLLPEGSNFKNAEEMWNDVEKNEKSEKAVVGQRVHIAIPKELSIEAAKQLVDEYALARAKEGRGVSIAFHNEPGNPHIDAILTPRPWHPGKGWGAKSQSVVMTDKDGNPILNPNRGKAGQPIHKRKNVNIDDKTNLTRRRKEWEELANAKLEQEGFSERIDCRSLKAQRQEAEQEYLAGRGSYEKVIELSRTPTIHEYRIKDRQELNEKIKAGNAALKEAMTDEWNLEKQICKTNLKINRTKWRKNENERRKGKTTEYLINDRSAGRVFSASLDRQRGIPTFSTVAESNGVPELSKRGLDDTQKKNISANVLLPRIKPDNMDNEGNRQRTERRRTYRNLSASHSQHNRRYRGYRAGAVTVCRWNELSQVEKMAVGQSVPLFYKEFSASRSITKMRNDFVKNAVFARSQSGNIRLLPINQQKARSAGLLNNMGKSKKFSPRQVGQVSKSFKAAGGTMQAASRDMGGKGREKDFQKAKQNIKELFKTPAKVANDICTNPLTGILKLPFRIAEAVDNAAAAGVNLANAAGKGYDKEQGGGTSGGGNNAREEEDKKNGLDSWKWLSEARRAEKEIDAYIREVRI